MKLSRFVPFLGSVALITGLFASPREATAESLTWHDVAGFGVEGQGWHHDDLESPFDRLPAKAQDVVRGAVWNLSRQSAGLSFLFNTDATDFEIRYTLGSDRLALAHMPATGVSGIDLYALSGDEGWRWVAVSRPESGEVRFRVQGLDAGKRSYKAYLPLYNSVTRIEVGIPPGKVFEAVAPRLENPIVFYGTSITQGASASRPGMVHTAILERRLNRPIVNLGFSGNGKMEPELGALLAEIDAAVYVIDCLPNMTESDVDERAEDFVRSLRRARPDTPIVLVEDRTYADSWIRPAQKFRNQGSRSALVRAYDNLVSSGVGNLHYVEGDRLLGADGEATTDGSHPSDLGFMRQADAMEPLLKSLIGAEN